MITPSTIYWLTRLDGIHNFFLSIKVLSFLLGVGVLVAGLCLWITSEEEEEQRIKGFWRCAKFAIVAFCGMIILDGVSAFIPTTKEMAAIIVIPKVANSESVQQFGNGIINLANQWMEELAPKKEEK